MTSLWRKRKTNDKVATDVHHNEQKHDNLSDPLDLLHQENVRLGLYEDVYDLSIKSEKAMREVQRLGQEIQPDVNQSLWVDPPEGWRYGFPAIYDPASDGVMRDWIISKGYPAKLIQEYGDVWFVRCWSAEEVKPSDESD